MTFYISVCGLVSTVRDLKWLVPGFRKGDNKLVIRDKLTCFRAAGHCDHMNKLAAPAAMRYRC